MGDDIKSSAPVWDNRPHTDSPPAYMGVQANLEQEDSQSSNRTNATNIATSAPANPRRTSRRSQTYDPLRSLTTLQQIPHHRYNIPNSTLSADRLTVLVKQPPLYTSTSALLPFIHEQSRLPPRPTLRITGRHNTPTSPQPTTDFSLTLNLTPLINLNPSTPRIRLKSAQTSPFAISSSSSSSSTSTITPLRHTTDPAVTASQTQTIKRFCADRSEHKSLTLTRSLHGFPTEMLAGQIRNLAAEIRYRGVLSIEVVCERSKVVVQREPGGLGRFVGLLGLSRETRFEVPEVVWSVGGGEDGDGDESEEGEDEGMRVGQEWWGAWRGVIRNAMIRRYRGVVGVEQWIEWRMGDLEGDVGRDWGVEGGG